MSPIRGGAEEGYLLDARYLHIACPFHIDRNSNFAMKIIVRVNNPVDIIVKTIENTRVRG